jgi:hypothetical protein
MYLGPAMIEKDRSNFYDGGVPATDEHPEIPPDRDADLVILLDRFLDPDSGREGFHLRRRIAYADRRLGQILVPADLEVFSTDLTSVPALFTWLVPKTGEHLPAALLHDGLVLGKDLVRTYEADSEIDRVEADRVFRDAMADMGTGVVRRWLVWAAVTTATMVLGRQVPWSPARTWHYRLAVGAMVLTVLVLGTWATLDLFDLTGDRSLRWMGERSWPVEVIGGLSGAIAIPLALGLFWGRFRAAGWIVGPLLAVLLPVTLVVGTVAAAYAVSERLVRAVPAVARLALLLVVAGATIAFLVLVAPGA